MEKINISNRKRAKNKKVEDLINEALELIELYGSNNTHEKFSSNHTERLAGIYNEFEGVLSKRFMKNNIEDSLSIIELMKKIISILKDRDLEIDKKSLKELKRREDYLLKLQGKKAGSPIEVYVNAKNKANSIMDKGLSDEDSILNLSMLLDEMKSAYEEDNDTGGSGKLHIGECLQDFKKIEGYIKRVRSGKPANFTIHDRIEELKNNIENMLPKDNKYNTLLSPIGTTEREGEEELIKIAKEVNSSKKVAAHIDIMRKLGRIGLFVSIFVLLLGISFDLEYHLPKFKPMLEGNLSIVGTGIFWLLTLFIAILFASLLHIPLEGYVNKKWSPQVRKYLLLLLLISIPAIIYIDYRAVQNYSKMTAGINIDKELSNSNSALGAVAMNNKQDLINRQNEIKSFQEDIARLKDENSKLNSKIDEYQAIIDRIDNKKRRTRRDNSTRWRNSQKIKNLKKEILSNKNEIKLLEDKIEKTKTYIKENQKALVSVASKADELKDEEAKKRAMMMYVLIALIDLSSLLKIYADYLNNKNLPIDLDLIHEINTTLKVNEILREHSKLMLAQQGTANQKLFEIDRFTHSAQIGNLLQGQISNMENTMLIGQIAKKHNEQTTKLIQENLLIGGGLDVVK